MAYPAWIVRLRPLGPWRPGSSTGDRDTVERILHSDTLYSALTWAFHSLGMVDEWLGATAETETPAVRLSSCFPFVGRTLLAPAPRHVWPPTNPGKVRWKSARYIPLSLIGPVLRGETPNEDRWAVDPVSQCLLPVEKNGVVTEPFRIAKRTAAAVDRMTQSSTHVHSAACLEFSAGAGMWCAASFADDAAFEAWGERVRAAFRLLADTGVGGERTRGWGRFEQPEMEKVQFPDFINVPRLPDTPFGYWLLSLFQPSAADTVDWDRGAYSLVTRSGRIDSRTGSHDRKPANRMVEEGSVLLAGSEPAGAAVNVAAANVAHPVYRSGFAFAVPISYRQPAASFRPAAVEEPVSPAEPAVEELPPSAPAEPVEEEAPVENNPPAEPEIPVEAVEPEPVPEPEPEPELEAPSAESPAEEERES